jgi:hypothetical protein
MLRRIAVLEEMLAKVSGSRPGIGHNGPPEAIEVPFGLQDRVAVQTAIVVLKIQPVEPSPSAAVAAREAAERVETIGQRLRTYLAEKGDRFVSKAVDAAGEEVGKRAVQAAFWLALAKALLVVAQAVSDWLASLNLPL